MATTQSDIDALETAIKSGAKKVKFRDRETEYRDLSEMKQILADMKAEMTGSKRPTPFFSSYGRGYK